MTGVFITGASENLKKFCDANSGIDKIVLKDLDACEEG